MGRAAESGEATRLSRKLDKNISLLKERMAIDENFDVILREMTIGNQRAALIFIDGLTNDQIVTLILHLRSSVPLAPYPL